MKIRKSILKKLWGRILTFFFFFFKGVIPSAISHPKSKNSLHKQDEEEKEEDWGFTPNITRLAKGSNKRATTAKAQTWSLFISSKWLNK